MIGTILDLLELTVAPFESKCWLNVLHGMYVLQILDGYTNNSNLERMLIIVLSITNANWKELWLLIMIKHGTFK